jgi:hypothetical protein
LDGGFNIFEQEGPWGTFRDFAGWAASVLGLVWCYKLAARARALSLDGRPSPGWALGSWFIPVAHVVLPFIPLHAAWKRLGGKSGVFVAWAVLWGTSLFLVYVTVGAAVRFGYNALEHQAVGTTVTYDVPRDLVTLAYLHAAVTTGAAIALGMMVMETRRMERQTAVQPAKAPPPAGPPQPPVR